MRIALKIAYDGTYFYGYARQPNLMTVEGLLIKNLKKIGAFKDEKNANFQSASRTDKGVNAAGNVIAFNTSLSINRIIKSLNSLLDNIWILGGIIVNHSFNPRHANMRWYRYYLYYDTINYKKFEESIHIFEGKHNFKNFAKACNKEPVRTISDISLMDKNNVIVIDIKAQEFLWNQIRRIVAAAKKVGKGIICVDDLKYALNNPDKKIDYGIASPNYLLLVDIGYKNIHFEIYEEGFKKLKKIWRFHNYKVLFLEMIKNANM